MNKKILEKLKSMKKTTYFRDFFNRLAESPITSWAQQSDRGAPYAWRIPTDYSFYAMAYSQSGVPQNAFMQRPLTFKSSSIYRFKFLYSYDVSGGTPGQLNFSPFGVDRLAWNSAGAVLYLGPSYIQLNVNGVNYFNQPWSAIQTNRTWIDMIVRPDSYVKLKYWKLGTQEPTNYTHINCVTPKQQDKICFSYWYNTNYSNFVLSDFEMWRQI